MNPYEIKSLKVLKEWLATESRSSPHWFAAPSPARGKCLLISAESTVNIQWDRVSSERKSLFPFELPSAEQAREWWFAYWEGEIVNCWYHKFSRAVVLAKLAIWNALPDRYLPRRKSDFLTIDFATAETMVGAPEFGRMQSEVFFCGISARILSQESDELARLV